MTKHLLTKKRWKAIQDNNQIFDDDFYYGVTTTKIFCRPSCKSRLPNKEHVLIFLNSQEAIDNGFRPCKRCQPTGIVTNKEWIEQICYYLKNNFQQKLTLEIIAENCHGSAFNLQRTFKKIVGLSPLNYLNKIRLEHAKDLLISTDQSIKSIALNCGFNNDTYFSTLFKRNFQMTPTTFRNKGVS